MCLMACGLWLVLHLCQALVLNLGFKLSIWMFMVKLSFTISEGLCVNCLL